MFKAAGIGAAVHREIQTAYPPEMLQEAGRLINHRKKYIGWEPAALGWLLADMLPSGEEKV
jgi:hypothetical protein